MDFLLTFMPSAESGRVQVVGVAVAQAWITVGDVVRCSL